MPEPQQDNSILNNLWRGLTGAFSNRVATLEQGQIFDNCYCLHYPTKQQMQAELDRPSADSLLNSYSRYKFGCRETTHKFAEQLVKPISAALDRADLLPDECVILVPPARDCIVRSQVFHLAGLIGKILDIPCCSAVHKAGKFAEMTYSGVDDPQTRTALRQQHFKDIPGADGSAFHWILIDDAYNTGSTLRELDAWARKKCRVWSISQFALFKFDLDSPGQEAQINQLALKHGGIDAFMQIVGNPSNDLSGTAIRSIYASSELLEQCCSNLSLNKIIRLHLAGTSLFLGQSDQHRAKVERVFDAMSRRIGEISDLSFGMKKRASE